METQPNIFINYRRHDDAPGFALQLYKDLEKRFGPEQVFKDLRNIGPGEDFVESFSKQVNCCRVFLVVIGKDWLSILDKKRDEKRKDFVRLELRSALERRAQNEQSILIIPVLVDGADMPGEPELPDDLKKLAALNEYSLPEEYWETGIDRLATRLEEVLGITAKINVSSASKVASERIPQTIPETAQSKPLNFLFGVLGGGIGGLLVGAIVGAIYSRQHAEIPWWRFTIAGAVGLVVGALGGGFISYGITKAAKVLKGSGYASIIGGVLGGAVGGIPMLIIGGLIFFWPVKEGHVDPVLNAIGGGEFLHPLLIATAVAGSSFFIALGVLNPTRNRLLSVFIIACVTIGMLMLAFGVIAPNLQNIEAMLNVTSPLAPQVLIFGPLCGVFAGLQVGLALWACDRLIGSADVKG